MAVPQPSSHGTQAGNIAAPGPGSSSSAPQATAASANSKGAVTQTIQSSQGTADRDHGRELALGKGRAVQVAWSRDGRLLAVTSSSTAWIVHDVEITSTQGQVGGSNALGQHATGSSNAPTSSSDKTSEKNQPAHELRGHVGGVECAVWAPSIDGSSSRTHVVATCAKDRTVRIWDVRERPRHAFGYRPTRTIQTSGENISLAWSPCGRYLATGDKRDVITFIDLTPDLNAGQDQQTHASTDSLSDLDISAPISTTKGKTMTARGRRMGAQQREKQLLQTMKQSGLYSNARIIAEVNMRTALDDEVHQIAWNNAGDLFLMTTGLGNVKAYLFKELLAAGSKGNKVVQNTIDTRSTAGDTQSSIDLRRDGEDNTTRVIRSLRNASIAAHMATCYCLALDPRGRFFATGGGDATTNVWDTETLLCWRTLTRQETAIHGLSFSGDGEYIASSAEDSTIDISRVDTGDIISMITAKGPVSSVAFHPSRMVVAFTADCPNTVVGLRSL